MDFIKLLRRKKENTITEEVFTSSLVVYILSTVAYAIGPLVDGAMIGRKLGVDAVASYTLIWPMVFILSFLGTVLSGGLRNLYTDYLAEGKVNKANSAFSVTIVFCFVISILLCCVTIILINPIVRLLGAVGYAANLAPLVRRYIFGYLIGVPFMNVARIISNFMQMDADTPRAVYSVIVMTIVDIVCDFIAIYVLHGSMFSLAVATSLGNIAYFAVLMMHFHKKRRTLRFTLKNTNHAKEYISEAFSLGASTGVGNIANTISGILINNILAASASSMIIAAYSVHRSMGTLVNATYLGVGDTVWMLSGIYFGEEDKKALDELQQLAVSIGLRVTLVTGLFLVLFCPILATIYIGQTNPEAYVLAKQAIRFYGYSTPFFLLVYIFEEYLYGIKKNAESYVYTILVEGGALVPVVIMMIALFGGRGVWFATPTYLILLLILTYIYIQKQPYGKDFATKRLLLHPGFGSDAGAEISIDANTMLEVVGMSRLAGLFCKENGLSDKQGYRLSLFIEEMAGNIIRHGFNDGQPHTINMRILAKEDEVILRLRDNCKPFDPIQFYKMAHDENDLFKNMGIRIVMKTCKEIHYLSTFSTNNLIIKI